MSTTQPTTKTTMPDQSPAGCMDGFWDYLALALGIVPFPFFAAGAVAPEGRGT